MLINNTTRTLKSQSLTLTASRQPEAEPLNRFHSLAAEGGRGRHSPLAALDASECMKPVWYHYVITHPLPCSCWTLIRYSSLVKNQAKLRPSKPIVQATTRGMWLAFIIKMLLQEDCPDKLESCREKKGGRFATHL